MSKALKVFMGGELSALPKVLMLTPMIGMSALSALRALPSHPAPCSMAAARCASVRLHPSAIARRAVFARA